MKEDFFMYKIGIVVTIIMLALWFFLGFVMPYFFDQLPSNNGSFGDGFGSVNSL